MKEKDVTYDLQIFLPGSAESAGLHMRATTPFMPIQRGDLFSPRYGDDFRDADEVRGKLLRVTCVEHGIADLDDRIVHYVRVYGEAVPDAAAARFPVIQDT